jgi:hypothetical protein
MNRYSCKKNYSNKQGLNLVSKKENAICSLYEVENFLCKCSKALKYFKFCNFFK